jgi:hypothetical protein
MSHVNISKKINPLTGWDVYAEGVAPAMCRRRWRRGGATEGTTRGGTSSSKKSQVAEDGSCGDAKVKIDSSKTTWGEMRMR